MSHNHSPKSLVGRQRIRVIYNAPILENLNEILSLPRGTVHILAASQNLLNFNVRPCRPTSDFGE